MNLTKERPVNVIIGTGRLGAPLARASLLALLSATSAEAAQILPVYVSATETITPTAPPFGNSTFKGHSAFEIGHFNADGFVSAYTFGSKSYPSSPWSSVIQVFSPTPPQVIPGNPIIVWKFEGTLTDGNGNAFVTDAFLPGSPPILPPASAPLITIASNLLSGFAPFDVSGPIFAFDDPEQVGTWDVHISPASDVPEPPTLPLLAMGLAALAFVGRRKTTASARS